MANEPQPIQVADGQHSEAEVKGDAPVLAKIEVKKEPDVLVRRDEDLVKAANTTTEENKHSAGQRSINRTWENTQSIISIMVGATACAISLILVLRREYSISIQLISSMVFLVLSFYFARTNHTAVGGVKLPSAGR